MFDDGINEIFSGGKQLCYAVDIVGVGILPLCGNRFEMAYGRVTTGKLLEYLSVNRAIICPAKYRLARVHCIHKSKEGSMQKPSLEKFRPPGP